GQRLPAVRLAVDGDGEDVRPRLPRLRADRQHIDQVRARQTAGRDAGDVDERAAGADDHRVDLEVRRGQAVHGRPVLLRHRDGDVVRAAVAGGGDGVFGHRYDVQTSHDFFLRDG